MKKRQATPDHQELENQPGLANHATESDGSSAKSKSKERPKKKGKVLQERYADKSSTKKMEERKVLFDITVEVEDGREVHIQMKEGDSAEQVATKFCEEQNLPSQLVLPLTEHIVNNIVTISKEDKDIMLYFDDDHCRHHNGPDYGHELDEDYQNSKRIVERESKEFTPRKFKQPLQRKETPKRFKQRRISERLLSSTFTSSAKRGPRNMCDPTRKKNQSRRLSDKEKHFCTRLHGDFELYNRKREEDKKMYMDLYQKQIQKGKPALSKKSRRIMRVREMAAKQFQNYGELLYREAICSMQEKNRLIETRQEEKKKSELKEVTWKPKISKLARNLKRRAGEVWERLQCDKRSESRLQRLRNEAAESELMECSFKPQVNPLSPDIRDVNLGSVTRFDLLFWDAESRKKRQDRYMLWFPEGVTFRPAINKQHRACTPEPDRPHSSGSSRGIHTEEKHKKPRENVFTRLLEYAAKLTKKKQKANEHKATDPVTGQKLFTPMTGRGPLKRNEDELPIGEFLYNLKFISDEKKQYLADKYLQHWKEVAKGHHVLPTSEKLSKKFEKRNLHQLFSYLDKDQDGYVQLSTAETKNLNDEVILDIAEAKKLQPEAQKLLPFQKFVDLILAVQKSKRRGLHLILRSWRRKRPEKLTFQIKMDHRSRTLAARKRSFSSSEQWYAIILSERQKVQEKLEAARREREEKEISQCTFKPSTLGGPGKSRFKCSKQPAEKDIVRVEEKGQDDVHGYIIKETQVHGHGPQAAETNPAAQLKATQSESDSAGSSSGLLSVWKRFVAKPPEEKQQVKQSVESPTKSREALGFLSDIPEP